MAEKSCTHEHLDFDPWSEDNSWKPEYFWLKLLPQGTHPKIHLLWKFHQVWMLLGKNRFLRGEWALKHWLPNVLETEKERNATECCFVLIRAFSNAAFYAKRNIDAISAMDAWSTVITAIGAKPVAFRNASEKACRSKVISPSLLMFSSDASTVSQAFGWVEYQS